MNAAGKMDTNIALREKKASPVNRVSTYRVTRVTTKHASAPRRARCQGVISAKALRLAAANLDHPTLAHVAQFQTGGAVRGLSVDQIVLFLASAPSDRRVEQRDSQSTRSRQGAHCSSQATRDVPEVAPQSAG